MAIEMTCLTLTAIAAAVFFWLRVVHAIGMISGVAGFPVRPMISNLGWLCILVLAGQVLILA